MRYRSYLMEGFNEEGTPDMKYYAFDWDDNIVSMPTKIILKNDKGDEIEMGTEDFAEHRHDIGKKNFNYNGETIVGYADKPFRNFKVEGDRQFLIDAMRSVPGPAFEDFKESINNGSIFAIITARGHNPDTIKQAIYNYIISGFNGIDKNQLLKILLKNSHFFNLFTNTKPNSKKKIRYKRNKQRNREEKHRKPSQISPKRWEPKAKHPWGYRTRSTPSAPNSAMNPS